MTMNMKFFVRLARIIGVKSKTPPPFDSNVDLKGVVATGKKKTFHLNKIKSIYVSFCLHCLYCRRNAKVESKVKLLMLLFHLVFFFRSRITSKKRKKKLDE